MTTQHIGHEGQVAEPTPLEVRVRQILSQAEFPAMSRDALDALRAAPEDDASLQRLANLVLRDYALTLKVLRTANSAYYKRGGRPVQSAAHAMLLLGTGTVRSLAASLLMFDHYRRHAPGLRELMILGLLTANHARELAMLRRTVDPEEAHLAGMFHNLGEVLIAGYFPRDYARILHAHEREHRSLDAAALERLEFTFADLGEALARHWGMPESVITCTRASGPAGATELGAIVACAHDLTTAVYREEQPRPGSGVGDVAVKYTRVLGLTHADLGRVLRAALAETREVMTAAKVSIDALRLRQQRDAAIRELGGVPGVPTPPIVPAIDGEALTALRKALGDEARRAADPASGADVNRVILTMLEAIYRGGSFDRVIFCTIAPGGRTVKAHHGLGDGVDGLLATFSYELVPGAGPVATALMRRQALFVPMERDFTAQELRFAQSLGAGSFGVLPVVVAGRLVGCVYCDRPWHAPPPDAATVAWVRGVCSGAMQGITARRTPAGGPAHASGAHALQ